MFSNRSGRERFPRLTVELSIKTVTLMDSLDCEKSSIEYGGGRLDWDMLAECWLPAGRVTGNCRHGQRLQRAVHLRAFAHPSIASNMISPRIGLAPVHDRRKRPHQAITLRTRFDTI